MPDPTDIRASRPIGRLPRCRPLGRWGAGSTADARPIQAPCRSGIDIEDYQLGRVVRAIQMPRGNLPVADGAGLGKTIEAGMVALELIIRPLPDGAGAVGLVSEGEVPEWPIGPVSKNSER